MAVVIDLLSSSPVPRSGGVSCGNGRSIDLPTYQNEESRRSDSIDFDIATSLAFETERPFKRRRVDESGVTDRCAWQAQGVNGDCIFELSSEPDLDLHADQARLHSKRLEESLDLDLDNDIADVHPLSSSAPELSTSKVAKGPEIIDMLSDDDDDPLVDDPILSSSQPTDKSRPLFSTLTANLLAGLNSKDKIQPKCVSNVRSKTTLKSYARESKSAKQTYQTSELIDNIIDSSQPSVSKVSKRRSAEENDSRAAAKAAKEADREAQKELKRLEKERKQQEKQRTAEVAEANKSKTNKRNAATEMEVELPNSLQGTALGRQVEDLTNQLDVHTRYVSEEVDLINDDVPSTGNVVRWRRRITAEYDTDQEMWYPLEKAKVSLENHVLVHLTAEEFCTSALVSVSRQAVESSALSIDDMKRNLDNTVTRLRKQNPACRIIYLIQGLTAWLRKGQNAKNRAYTAAVRSHGLEDAGQEPLPGASSQAKTSRKRKANAVPIHDLSKITSDVAEDLLLHLQLTHQPFLIHHTTGVHTSAEQISSFTQHLATRPYRLAQQSHNLASSSFCMDTGQIRTSSDARETFVCMLQEINRVTPSMAHGIAASGYDSVRKLVQGFQSEGNLMLEDVRKAMNKDGGWSDRRLGPMVSKRLYKVFTGRDPGQTDGIA